MKTQEAKKIPITEVLSKLGFQPEKKFKGGIELGYLSPFRGEKEPSFFVNTQKNVWYDFGEKGGNLLDFVMRYKHTDLSGALNFLDELFGQNKYIPTQKPYKNLPSTSKPINTSTFRLNKIYAFGETDSSLKTYILAERNISEQVANAFLKEIHFTNTKTGKQYFAVGFENIEGSYEIRNPYFKSSIGKKNISMIVGEKGKSAILFEGFMDFLSYLSIKRTLSIEEDAIILNSVSFVEKALKHIHSKSYIEIKGYLDNDKTGGEKTMFFQNELKGIFNDQRFTFKPFKDLNSFLQNVKQV